MTTQANIAAQIEQSIPGLRPALHTPACEKSLYKQVDVLAHYVADKADEENLTEVKQALRLADDLYEQGNGRVRSAIENVLVYSFKGLFLHAGHNRHKLMALVPVTLFTLYMNQVLHRGC